MGEGWFSHPLWCPWARPGRRDALHPSSVVHLVVTCIRRGGEELSPTLHNPIMRWKTLPPFFFFFNCSFKFFLTHFREGLCGRY